MNYVTLGYETPLTLLIFVAGLLVVIYAQIKINSAYKISKNIKLKKKLSGVEVARLILDSNGLRDIYVTKVIGEFTDHYDPSRKVIRLSSDIFDNDSIASVSVSAHECGHAIQDKVGYTPMRIRSFLVPIVNFITYIGYFVSIISLFAGI